MESTAAIKLGTAELVKQRLDALFSRSFAELEELPETSVERVEVLGGTITLTVYRSGHNVDQLLIVVQAIRETLFGMTAQISVDGFVVSASGEKVRATEEVLWEYN